MAYLTTNAVVYRCTNLGESDRIVSLLTREAGAIKAVAKGAVKSQKRFFGLLLTGNHLAVRVFLKKKTTLHRLDAADLVESFEPLHSNPILFASASHLLELSASFALTQVADARQFALLTSTIRGLCNNGFQERFLRIFELRSLAYAGLAPNFEICSDCGKSVVENKFVRFSISDGSVLCESCNQTPELVKLPPGTRRLFSEIVGVESKKLPLLQFSRSDLALAKRTIPPFCEYVLGKKLRSLRMLKKLQSDRKFSG